MHLTSTGGIFFREVYYLRNIIKQSQSLENLFPNVTNNHFKCLIKMAVEKSLHESKRQKPSKGLFQCKVSFQCETYAKNVLVRNFNNSSLRISYPLIDAIVCLDFFYRMHSFSIWNRSLRSFVCVSGGKKYQFFGTFCLRTKWMTPM